MHAELLRAPVADVVIHHLGETVRFNLKYWEKQNGNTFGKEDDDITLEPFYEINMYWKSLPEAAQAQLFGYYLNIRRLLDEEFDLEMLHRKLSIIFSDIMKHHSYQDIKSFADSRLNIRIPKDFDDQFDPGSTNVIGTRERTYIKEDYRDLVILSIALRPLGVVFGEYINKAEKAVSNIWKELNAFYLLLDTWISQSEPMKRLEVYVEANVAAKVDDAESGLSAAIIAGIGTDDYPRWLLALTLMRKVVFADISGREDKSNIIQTIYGYIQSKLNNSNTNFKLTIHNKKLQVDADGEKDKLSYMESYKSKEDVAAGDICIVEHALMHPYELALELEPGIPRIIVEEAVESAKDLLQRNISDAQITMTQWILSPALPIRVMNYLEKSYVVMAVAITQAILWNRGFKSLAALVSSYPIIRNSEELQMGFDPYPVPRELTEKMNSYYPYSRRLSNRTTKKKPQPASIAMLNLFRKLTVCDWYLTLPNNWLSEVSNSRRYTAEPDLKIRLTELIIDLNERISDELPRNAVWRPSATAEL